MKLKKTLTVALLALTLAACGESIEERSRRDAEKAWSMKTAEQRESMCQGILILGPERIAREMKAGDRDAGRDTSKRDYDIVADTVTGKCLEMHEVDRHKAPKVLKQVRPAAPKKATPVRPAPVPRRVR